MAPRDELKVDPGDLIRAGSRFTSDGESFATVPLPKLGGAAATYVPGSLVQAALSNVDNQMLEMRQTISGHMKDLGAALKSSARGFEDVDQAAADAIRSVSPLNSLPPGWHP